MTTKQGKTDMLATAREAQWSAKTFMGAGTIKLVAPAKVNLLLNVQERRDDGYHEVSNVMHSLALHDILYMSFRPAEAENAGADSENCVAASTAPEGVHSANRDGEATPINSGCETLEISLEVAIKDCGAQGDPSAHFPLGEAATDPEKNLACKAVRKLAEKLEQAPSGKMLIRIEKHIPAQAGLGGGSTDAAAALIGAAHLWEIPKDDPAIMETAAQLGADVPFFLNGGCALLTGTGAVLQRTLDPMKKPLVLVKPEAGISTAQAYELFDENPIALPGQALSCIETAQVAGEVLLANNLTQAAESALPELKEISEWLASSDGVATGTHESAPQVLLCGSGSTVFAITETYSDALRIATQAQAHGWWSRATTLSSLSAAKVK